MLILSLSFRWVTIEIFNSFMDIFSLYCDFQRLKNEFLSFSDDLGDDSRIYHLTRVSNDNVDHSAHIGGAIAGIIMYFAHLTYRKVLKPRAGNGRARRDSLLHIYSPSNPNEHEWGAGNRLG